MLTGGRKHEAATISTKEGDDQWRVKLNVRIVNTMTYSVRIVNGSTYGTRMSTASGSRREIQKSIERRNPRWNARPRQKSAFP